ncbi:MAG TPA: phospholipase D-like domain-containing protein [Burkholderiaceae bacterium]|nr:phospholipase D-like domain-containing protein [Burkholderiaceae bacterium]
MGLYLAGLAAYSSLPVIVPDLARPSAEPVQLGGSHGPLSPARSEEILSRLARGGQETDIFARHLAVEQEIVGRPLTAGNDVVLLQDGPSTYQAMLAAILAARDHINMESYIFDDDEVGQRFGEALIAKQKQGVQVNLIRDSVGTLRTPAAFFERLATSGIKVLEFNPVNPLTARKDWALNQRDHRKLLIVDGRIAFLGGINVSSVYSGGSFTQTSRVRPGGTPPWRDTDLRLQGPVVAEFQELFLATWAAQRGGELPTKNYFPPPERAGRQVVRAIGSLPEEAFYATLLSAIGSAETSVHLTNAYFAPDPQLLSALKAAVGRGVDVKLILPSQTDSWLVFHAGRSYYDELLRARVKIYERHGVILHSKTALVDGMWTTVGSTNFDSFLHNHELNAVVLGREFGQQVQAMFARDLAKSDAITLERWQQRPLGMRVKEMLGRMWEYWL